MATDIQILIGSDSDLDMVEEALRTMKAFGVSFEIHILSAHRSPKALAEHVEKAEKGGTKVFITAAGGAAHLGGVVASLTTRPVLAIPISTSAFNGLDSLLSMVQMPSGVPVATFTVGKGGARNAALFAIQVLALTDEKLARKYADFKAKLAGDVSAKDAALQKKLGQ